MVKLVRETSDFKEMADSLREEKQIACDIEASGLDMRTLDIEGLGIGTSDKLFYIPFPSALTFEEIREHLKELFQDKEVIFHNANYDLQVFHKYKLPWPEKIHDTMIMSWLLDENVQHGLKALASSILGRTATKWVQIDRRPNLFRTEEDIVNDLATYCGDDVKNTFDLFKIFLPQLDAEFLMKDYEKIEIPLIKILAIMEIRGVFMDRAWLEKKKLEAEAILKEMEVKLRKMTGDQINIHSPIQLEKFLFENLAYKPPKVTPSGRKSTDNEALQEIIKANGLTDEDFVPLLLKFRDLDKVYRTYLIALIEQGGDENVIHTSFLQHGTRTGRLASRDPNLQNIPARHDDWDIRTTFIPRKGHKFVVADYSQIELRVLAHFSKDKNMVDVFKNDGDIHAKTMELTGTERRAAKAINFGLIYGMGPRTLAKTLSIKEEDAKSYIDKFFDGYPNVRFWTQRIQQMALTKGYVSMITGRKRRFSLMTDNKWFATIKRQAVNTKIQGSAADIIKLAMIKLHDRLKEVNAHMILQIHDEIVVETPEDKVEETTAIVKEVMENIVQLEVPLKIGLGGGDHWEH